MKELVEYLQKEWGTVMGAPWAFFVSAVLVAGVAYKASLWKHGAIIDHLRERLALKDAQLDDYREKLLSAPAEGSKIAPLATAELRGKALEFVASLREWAHQRTAQNRESEHLQWLAMTNAKDEVERKKLWDSNTLESTRFYTVFMNEYEAQFKVKAIVMRDELLSRGVASTADGHRYEHPTNPLGVTAIADDLERMALTLK